MIIKDSKTGKEIQLTLGDAYAGEGYSGVTDGIDISGELIEVNVGNNSATIKRFITKWPCAVKLNTLYSLEREEEEKK